MSTDQPRLSFNGPSSVTARRAGWAGVLVAVVVLLAVGARTTPDDGLSDDRLYALGSQMKCLQCAGESVAGSQADIAIKWREEIRDQMRRGRSDDEILTYFANTYGQRVLLTPPSSGVASLVWVIPVVVGGAGLASLAYVLINWRRGRHEQVDLEVSEADRTLVESALVESALVESTPPRPARTDS